MTWAIRHLPFYGRWYRFLLFWPACDGGLAAMRIDPDYPHQDRAVSEINDAAREVFTQWMADQVGDDAELLAKVVPDYVCLGKRTLQDNGIWLGALTRDDVDLVTDADRRGRAERHPSTPTATLHEVDVIVWCHRLPRQPLPVADGDRRAGRAGAVRAVGRRADGALRHHRARASPTCSCSTARAPTWPTAAVMIFHAECQVRYVMGCLGLLADAGRAPRWRSPPRPTTSTTSGSRPR